MEKKLFSNSVFSPVIIGSSTGFGTNGDKHYEVVFSLAIVWMDGDDWIDIWEVIVIGFHICNLREKLYQATPNALFTIRSVREVGYCFFTDCLIEDSFDPQIAETDACRIEHVISEETFCRLKEKYQSKNENRRP